MINLSHFFSQLEDKFIYFGMPAVTLYHLICSNVFLNTAAEDASGLEKMGNVILTPFRYLFAGHTAFFIDEEKSCYDICQCFDYQEQVILKSTGALIVLPFSVVVGSVLKAAAYLSHEVQMRHRAIATAWSMRPMISNLDSYKAMGIQVDEMHSKDKLVPIGYARGPADEAHLFEEKEAFAQIVRLLKENKILFWADCGTCLGAYRYGGIIPWDNDLDIAILKPDFENMLCALSELESSKYLVQDWSNRSLPRTYVRVYIRSTRGYIDIYTYAIHSDTNSVQYICSNESNMFMLEGWKINERRYMVQTPFAVVFPLKIADFDGIQIPVPNQTEKYLQMRYGENLSPVKIYNPETGLYEKDLSHPYWERAYAH